MINHFLSAALCLLAMTGPGLAAGAVGEALDWRGVALPGLDGAPLAPESFVGKAVLVVNTASFCGFTPQYQGLEKLWQDYRGRGLVVLGVPSNDFGGQEPGSEAEVKTFCDTNYNVDFPMTAKQKVSGSQAHPLYLWAAGRTGFVGVPRWNFHKLLIGRDGRLVDWFSSVTSPDSDRLRRAVEAALAE